MDVTQQRKDGVLIVSLSGRFDNPAAQEFVKTITQLIESGEHKIILNFTQLSYLSSSGLRALQGAAKRMDKKEGTLVLCSLQGLVMRVVEITGFHKVLTIYDDEEDALQHCLSS
jgi:anti-anti-sigma factor